MANSRIIKGSEIKVYISGKLFAELQSATWTVDYGEAEIYGIDSQFAQELAPTKVSVQGSVSGVRVKLTGGLQGHQARTRIHEILHSPYTSLRVQDRQTSTDIFFLPQMKVTSESITVQAKGIMTFSFKFKGIIPYHEIDLDGKNS